MCERVLLLSELARGWMAGGGHFERERYCSGHACWTDAEPHHSVPCCHACCFGRMHNDSTCFVVLCLHAGLSSVSVSRSPRRTRLGLVIKKLFDFNTVTLSFLFDKYYSIIE